MLKSYLQRILERDDTWEMLAPKKHSNPQEQQLMRVIQGGMGIVAAYYQSKYATRFVEHTPMSGVPIVTELGEFAPVVVAVVMQSVRRGQWTGHRFYYADTLIDVQDTGGWRIMEEQMEPVGLYPVLKRDPNIYVIGRQGYILAEIVFAMGNGQHRAKQIACM